MHIYNEYWQHIVLAIASGLLCTTWTILAIKSLGFELNYQTSDIDIPLVYPQAYFELPYRLNREQVFDLVLDLPILQLEHLSKVPRRPPRLIPLENYFPALKYWLNLNAYIEIYTATLGLTHLQATNRRDE